MCGLVDGLMDECCIFDGWINGSKEGGREGRREGGWEGGREGRREGGRVGGREGGKKEGREGGREEKREGGMHRCVDDRWMEHISVHSRSLRCNKDAIQITIHPLL